MKVRNSSFRSSATTHDVVAIALACVLALGTGAIPAAASAVVTSDAGTSAAVETTAVANGQLADGYTVATWAAQAADETTQNKAAAEKAAEQAAAAAKAAADAKAAAKKKAKKKLTVKQTVAKVGRDHGLSKAGVAALLWICKRESNFHPASVSKSGTYHGLFQLSKGIVKGHPWKDPVWNTKRAIKYMKGRYGSVLKAKAWWATHHWY